MKLAEYLKAHKIKNRDFAKTIGVHPGSIPRYKKPKANPPTSILKKIKDATDGMVDAEDFASEEDL